MPTLLGRDSDHELAVGEVGRAGVAVDTLVDLELLFAGIDLKQTPEGEFFCFEVNPCPGFLYYERNTRQPISTALADLLHRSAQSRAPGPAP